MSKQKHIIEVVPPDFQQINETMHFCGFDCTGCGGSGEIKGRTIGHNKHEINICSHCNGSGKLMVEVTFKWKPF